jgi:hypothetical protein
MLSKTRTRLSLTGKGDHPFVSRLISAHAITLPRGMSLLVPMCRCRFDIWQGKSIPDTYGGKAVLKFGNEPVFAELAILRILQEAGWEGVWVDTFRGKFRKCMPPDSCQLPPHAKKVYNRVCRSNNGKTSGCFDVFAWKGKRYLFVESKRRGKDAIRRTQIEWICAALNTGILLSSLLICEWEPRHGGGAVCSMPSRSLLASS